ncbi:MAG TPA: response regulator transcription factor [Thermoanaerobaculia bacterium]|jgi:DNA-binding NarL/FixJ family response regulator|nr:response regulator transcription factor [Thermoanaerobaculia bacterium]
MTRILLVDDHTVVRQGLKQILGETAEALDFGDAANGAEALQQARSGEWDLVVLDMSLPDRSGLDVLKELRQIRPRLPVLVLSMHPEEQLAVRALRAGAAGYVTKRTAAADIATAVNRVLAGGRYVSPALAERLAAELRAGDGKAPHETLSDREYQVFRLLAAGHTVKHIGGQLRLSPQTVSTHRSRILEKMGLSTNAELTQYAIQNRLLG